MFTGIVLLRYVIRELGIFLDGKRNFQRIFSVSYTHLVFRSSALYRSKWERDDYRENTINAGISACNGVFHRSKMEHPDFIKFNEQTGEPYVSVPLLAKYVREHLLVNIVNGQMTVCEPVSYTHLYTLASMCVLRKGTSF